MGTLHTAGAIGAGLAAPEPAHKDEAPGLARHEGFRGQEQGEVAPAHSACEIRSAHALRVIGGERRAVEFLASLAADQCRPDELALIVAAMYGPTLRGFCAVITKALAGVGGAR